MESIAPELQGRVFAANSLVMQGVSTVATLVAGPLAEYIFEPTVYSRKMTWIVGPVLGSQLGAGTALLYVFTSLALILVGIGGYCLSPLLWANDTSPNDSQKLHDEK